MLPIPLPMSTIADDLSAALGSVMSAALTAPIWTNRIGTASAPTFAPAAMRRSALFPPGNARHRQRDESTAKLESLGLVQRQANAADRRVREAVVSPEGKAMTDRVDAARDRIGRAIFETWDPREIDDLTRLMRKFADAMKEEPSTTS